MSSLSSVGGSSSSANLYQVLMQELQGSSLSSSISSATSLNPATMAIDQILFSGASVSSAPSSAPDMSGMDAYQQYLSQAYKAS